MILILTNIKKNIVIYKDCFNINENCLKNNFWINFDSRIAKKSKDKDYLSLFSFFKDYGIRFVYFYQN
jgi:hypothetical protein